MADDPMVIGGVLRDIQTEADLVGLCMALIGHSNQLSQSEQNLADACTASSNQATVETVRNSILNGLDPLGEAFAAIRPADERRAHGAVYTPYSIVRSMMTWLADQGPVERVVDPGAGSGRYIVTAAEFFPEAELVAVEMDPLAALMLRANVAVRGLNERTQIIVQDYRSIDLGARNGTTAFVGNPPYVRHHAISDDWKCWYVSEYKKLGVKASALAGLHLHFFLKTNLLAKPGDIGAFITSAEWMDVNYGSALRHLLTDELGGVAMHVLNPTAEAFPGTITTAAITCFRVGETNQPVRVRAVENIEGLNGLTAGSDVAREVLQAEHRWSIIVRPPNHETPEATIELGELFDVHRGQVTGANKIWIAGEHSLHLPERVKIPTITKALDLIRAGHCLETADDLRRVIDLPVELDDFTPSEKRRIKAFLSLARSQGCDDGYVASHRKAWWSVGLKPPAPILCTYMGRRPPQFTINACAARHINVAHGLYPRVNIDEELMLQIVNWLNTNITVSYGRTYAGGLTKFEPREVQRLKIPELEFFQT